MGKKRALCTKSNVEKRALCTKSNSSLYLLQAWGLSILFILLSLILPSHHALSFCIVNIMPHSYSTALLLTKELLSSIFPIPLALSRIKLLLFVYPCFVRSSSSIIGIFARSVARNRFFFLTTGFRVWSVQFSAVTSLRKNQPVAH